VSPYALKAQDATTLQGHGFGEFMMKNDSPTVGGKKGPRDSTNVDNGSGGTTNQVAKWTNSTTLGNSVIYDNGTNVGIGTATPGALLECKREAIWGQGWGIRAR